MTTLHGKRLFISRRNTAEIHKYNYFLTKAWLQLQIYRATGRMTARWPFVLPWRL
jgi:hypothetical protein